MDSCDSIRLNELPDEVLAHILGFASSQQLPVFAALRLVNRTWDRLIVRLLPEKTVEVTCKVTPNKSTELKRSRKFKIPLDEVDLCPANFKIRFHLTFETVRRKSTTSISQLEGNESYLDTVHRSLETYRVSGGVLLVGRFRDHVIVKGPSNDSCDSIRLNELPDEVLAHILGFASSQQLPVFAALRLVNRTWDRLIVRLLPEKTVEVTCKVTPNKSTELKRSRKFKIPLDEVDLCPANFKIRFHLTFETVRRKSTTSISQLEGRDKTLVEILDRIPNIDMVYVDSVSADLFDHSKMETVKLLHFHMPEVTYYSIDRIFEHSDIWNRLQFLCFDYPKEGSALERLLDYVSECYAKLPNLHEVNITIPYMFSEEPIHCISEKAVEVVQGLMALRRDLYLRLKMKRRDFATFAASLNEPTEDHVLSSMFTITLEDGWLMQFLWMERDFNMKLHNEHTKSFDGNFLPKFR
ncbi:hypothetical protein QR680_003991 [Steinernema hermaphroditum]|uniref:F-box domain-containing protein n=1 Tax=Steinernema hermaphroditum TaxID=289476 RepID=A0AA39HPI4_9BILA|nr:hypothetical protein QR680_003991 [Steinernema hermaphroditum]